MQQVRAARTVQRAMRPVRQRPIGPLIARRNHRETALERLLARARPVGVPTDTPVDGHTGFRDARERQDSIYGLARVCLSRLQRVVRAIHSRSRARGAHGLPPVAAALPPSRQEPANAGPDGSFVRPSLLTSPPPR